MELYNSFIKVNVYNAITNAVSIVSRKDVQLFSEVIMCDTNLYETIMVFNESTKAYIQQEMYQYTYYYHTMFTVFDTDIELRSGDILLDPITYDMSYTDT